MNVEPTTPQDSAGNRPEAEGIGPVCFRRLANRESANILAAVLNDNGVEASVFADDAGGAMPFIGNLEGYRVMIAADASGRALEVVSEAGELLAAALAASAPGNPAMPPAPPQEAGAIVLGEGVQGKCCSVRRTSAGLIVARCDTEEEHFVPESAFHLKVHLDEDDPQGPVLVAHIPEQHDFTVKPADVPTVRAWLGPFTVHHLRSAVEDSGCLILPLAILSSVFAVLSPSGIPSLVWSSVAVVSFIVFLVVVRATFFSVLLIAVVPELCFVAALILQMFAGRWPTSRGSGLEWLTLFAILAALFAFEARHAWKTYRRFRRAGACS